MDDRADQRPTSFHAVPYEQLCEKCARLAGSLEFRALIKSEASERVRSLTASETLAGGPATADSDAIARSSEVRPTLQERNTAEDTQAQIVVSDEYMSSQGSFIKYTGWAATILATFLTLFGLVYFSTRSDVFGARSDKYQGWSAANDFIQLCQDPTQNRTNRECRKVDGKQLKLPPHALEYCEDIVRRVVSSRTPTTEKFKQYPRSLCCVLALKCVAIVAMGLAATVLVTRQRNARKRHENCIDIRKLSVKATP